RDPWAVPVVSGLIAAAIWYWAFVMPALRAERALASAGDGDAVPLPAPERHWIEARAFNFAGIAAWLAVTVLGGSKVIAHPPRRAGRTSSCAGRTAGRPPRASRPCR
ncbi:MAG: hypothetical protein ACKOFI_09190, partial [Phycisphaerales bacterium]